MSTETGGPSPEEMGVQPEAKTEMKLPPITTNPDGTFTARLPVASLEEDPDMLILNDFKFDTLEKAEKAVAEAIEDMKKN